MDIEKAREIVTWLGAAYMTESFGQICEDDIQTLDDLCDYAKQLQAENEQLEEENKTLQAQVEHERWLRFDKEVRHGGDTMIRTQKEWLDWCLERGTSGDMVYDILKDWNEEVRELKRLLGEYSVLRGSLFTKDALCEQIEEQDTKIKRLEERVKELEYDNKQWALWARGRIPAKGMSKRKDTS